MDLSPSQIEDIKEAFELFSNDEGRTIRLNQVGDVVRALGECPTNEDTFKALGKPGNDDLKKKRVCFEEFLAILSQIQKSSLTGTYEDFVEGLRIFDKDGNGTVRGAEIRRVLTTLGEKLSSKEVSVLMKGQEDSNGVINYSEFSKFLLEKQI